MDGKQTDFWQDRVIQERDELAGRVKKLDDFTSSKAILDLEEVDVLDLMRQLQYMSLYLGVLNDRISRF